MRPEEPETALARGAALASANAPLFSSSTAALAYAQDPGTGFINPYAVAPGYFDVAVDNASGEQALAYSAVADDDADAYTALAGEGDFETGTYTGVIGAPVDGGRRPLVLVASAVAAIFVVGAAALLVALAISMRPTASVRPEPGHNAVAPKPAPAAPAAPAPVQAPAAPAPGPAAPAPEPAPAAPAPAPAARLPNLYQPRRPRFQNLLLRPRPPRRLLRLPWLLSRFRCPFRCRGSSGLGRDRRSGRGAAITVAEAGVAAVTPAAASAAAADLALATVFNLRLQTVT